MKSPIIGITGDVMITKFYSNFTNKRAGINNSYVKATIRSNAIPIILPISEEENAKQLVSSINGLILSGGNDVSPQIYNEEPIHPLRDINPKRDSFEMALLKEAILQGKPVLAICRGFQLLNVAYGGTLYQDVSCNSKFTIQHFQQSDPVFCIHNVETQKGSFINSVLGEKVMVNSIHHQMIKEVSPEFNVTAWSKDGVIEAIEKKDGSFVVGIQWHPEILSKNDKDMQNIFNVFVNKASKGL